MLLAAEQSVIANMSNPDVWRWPDAGLDTFERYNRLLGDHVVVAGAMRWRQVRPFFFAPLLPYERRSTASLEAPPSALWGGVQYAIPEGEASNSWINLSMFLQVGEYSLAKLDYNRRRQVRLAQRHFEIRPIADPLLFARQAYPVYRDFYRRTQYEYGAQRRNAAFFETWSDSIFRLPGLAILGGFRGDELGGVSISMRVEDVLLYTTFFCDTESMRQNLPDLMLHTVRSALAHSGEARAMYVGGYKGRKDDFYTLRGAECVRLPARLRLNPLAKRLLKWVRPNAYERLLGQLPREE